MELETRDQKIYQIVLMKVKVFVLKMDYLWFIGHYLSNESTI